MFCTYVDTHVVSLLHLSIYDLLKIKLFRLSAIACPICCNFLANPDQHTNSMFYDVISTAITHQAASIYFQLVVSLLSSMIF